MSAEALQREQKVAEWTAEKRAKGETVLEPKKIIQSGMRGLSIGRILIAAVIPGVSIVVLFLSVRVLLTPGYLCRALSYIG